MSQRYFSVWTQAGLALRAQAIATGKPLILKYMGVGDGGANDGSEPPTPNALQTALKNEKHRQQINESGLSPTDPNQTIFAIVVALEIGGFWVKELGLYSEDGTLVAVGSMPPSYKATVAEGSPSDIQFTMILLEASAEIVQVIIDPTAVLATKAYVSQMFLAHETSANPHPQYAMQSQSILVFKDVPLVNQGDFIFHPVFGFMAWNQKWQIYRSFDCGRKVNGWALDPLPGYIEGNGATYSKTGNYKGLWTAAQDYGLVIPPAGFAVGQYLFVDVDADTFRVPDLRAYFDRNTEAVGREHFTAQDDTLQDHTHTLRSGSGSGSSSQYTMRTLCIDVTQNGRTLSTIDARISDETKPKNTAYPAWIKL